MGTRQFFTKDPSTSSSGLLSGVLQVPVPGVVPELPDRADTHRGSEPCYGELFLQTSLFSSSDTARYAAYQLYALPSQGLVQPLSGHTS